MTTSNEMFTGRDDRARVLSEILRQGPAACGTTLIAHVDRATLEVLGVRALTTPDPVLDTESCFADEPIHQLSAALCSVAQESAPERTRDGRGWSAITGELITVVCREGEAAITPTETQFYWGWRYSNHLTTAIDGDVYVVTPQGWASLYGKWSGESPILPTAAGDLISASEVQDAEKILADLSHVLLGPAQGECLLCYVYRMIAQFGCNCRLRFAAHYRGVRAPRATGLEGRLGQMGGFCDCEIFLNGYELRPEHWVPESAEPDEDDEDDEDADYRELTWPDPIPECRGVRAGSTQPCSLWWRLRRW